ncbi:tetratricopeptide repeat protein [Kitasatospora sp. NPDC093806]|uniref:tetratricopeptide repeat protein n=1 Tax=Kitasatospora sp. NPDC093806 TaxID=3155075 RepID=UPI00344580B3
MVERLVLDLHSGGRVSVMEWPPGEAIPAPPVDAGELRWPLDDRDLADLRWYLEEYLRAPFGVYGDRGPDIARRLPEWGARIFAALFGTGPARDAYLRARARGGGLELVLRSDSARLLALPWELMADPGRPSPLALDGVAVSRNLPTAQLGRVFRVSGSCLRVLLVIARPAGPDDVGYRMIARPLLRRLKAVRGELELVVLRPPTLARLSEVLQEARAAGRPFQLVHFDGHGVFGTDTRDDAPLRPGVGRRPLTFQGPGPRGMLVFETPGGGAELVPAERVARVLAAAEVPLVVLNACQSAALAAEVEAAVATRLLQEGALAVLAMAYSVYAVAAAEFMGAFYERLFAGDRVSEAVTAGRRQLAAQDRRPSPKGRLPLADWMVPVLYSRNEVALPGLRSGTAPGAGPGEDVDEDLAEDLDEDLGSRILDLVEAEIVDPDAPDGQDPDGGPDGLAPVGEFVGRDGLLLRLDVGARLRRVVVLHGSGGVGKTELAKAFGRWCRDTGAVTGPDPVIWHTFEPGVASFGLTGVIDRLGRRLFPDDERFDLLPPAKRQEAVERLLAARSLLLIWDNVESVYSMPDPTGATPPLAEAQRAELRAFLERVARRGRSTVVLTSRTPEDWLGPDPLRIEVAGLDPEEAVEYAEQVLAPYPGTARRREQRAFGELLEWLDGHPLSMRLVLPSLAIREPRQVLDALMRGEARLLGDEREARGASLAASIAYSLAHLPEADRRALAAVTLFQGTADANLLQLLSRHPLTPARFRDRDGEEWQRLLRRAAGLGLLTESAGAAFRLHPALPAHLTARWRAEEADFAEQRAAALLALVDAQAHFCSLLHRELNGGNTDFALTAIDHQRRTVGSLLGHALDHGLWEQALHIVRPLDDYWDLRGLYAEARGWVDRARLALEGPDGGPPGLDTPAGALWVFLVGSEGQRQLLRGRPDEAERSFRTIHEAVRRQPPGPERLANLAHSQQALGRVAVDRGDWEDAEQWYLRSLTVLEQLDREELTAVAHHQLGVIAHHRGRLADAERWTRQALAVHERRGGPQRAAPAYHQLGLLAQEQGRFEEAGNWYGRALAVAEQLGDRPKAARIYHQLATIATDLGLLAEAEEWCKEALAISEELGSRPDTARSYHQLGMLASMRDRLREAEAWHRKALELRQDIGDRHGTASSHHQLGLVAFQRGDLADAERWLARAMTVREELGDPAGLSTTYHQRGVTAQAGGRAADAEAWYRKALEVSHRIEDRPGLARTFGQFGLLAEEQGRPREALEWLVRSVTCFEEFPHPLARPSAVNLRLLTRELGLRALERAWRSVTGRRLPGAVRDHVQS